MSILSQVYNLCFTYFLPKWFLTLELLLEMVAMISYLFLHTLLSASSCVKALLFYVRFYGARKAQSFLSQVL